MDKPWRIVYWRSMEGNNPVYEFINNLEYNARTKVYYILELLKEYGVTVGAPHIKKVIGTPLWEIRVLGKDNIRIFYVTQTDKAFLLLHGFKKKIQKTSPKEIKIALERLKTSK